MAQITFTNAGGIITTSHLKASGTYDLSNVWDPGLIAGSDGHDKIVASYLASSTNGAVLGAHNSGLSAWSALNLAGTSINFRVEQTTKMTLTNAGSLGIGTTSPAKKLDVSGSARATDYYVGTAGAYISYNSSSGAIEFNN